MFVDAMSRQPVYSQIIDQIEQMVLSGLMRPGEQVPSVRSLSLELSLNPNTIQKAYAELDSRGILYAIPGRGCFISENAPVLIANSRRKRLGEVETLAHELQQAGVPLDEVLDCVRRAYEQAL